MESQYVLPNLQAGSVQASMNGSPIQHPGQHMQIGQPMSIGHPVNGEQAQMNPVDLRLGQHVALPQYQGVMPGQMAPGMMSPGMMAPGMPQQQQFGAFPTDMNAAAMQIQQQQTVMQVHQSGRGKPVTRNYIRPDEWDKSRLPSPSVVVPTQKTIIDDKGQEQKYYSISVPYNYGSTTSGAERWDTLKIERPKMRTGPIQRNAKAVKYPKYQVKEFFTPSSDPQQALMRNIAVDLKEWAIDVITFHRNTIGQGVVNYKTFGRPNPQDRAAQGTALMKDLWFQKSENSPMAIFYEVKYFESRDKQTGAITSISQAEWKLPCPPNMTVQQFQQLMATKLRLPLRDLKIIGKSIAIPWEMLKKFGIESTPIVEFTDLFVGATTAKFRPKIGTAIFSDIFHVGDDQAMTEEEMLAENPEYSTQALDKFVDMLGSASSAPSTDASAFDLSHNPAAQIGSMLPPPQNGMSMPPGGAIPAGGSISGDQDAAVAQMIAQMGLSGNQMSPA